MSHPPPPSRYEPSPPPIFAPPPPVEETESAPRFISLRWKALAPLVLVVLLVSMAGAYLAVRSLVRSAVEAESEQLARAGVEVHDRAGAMVAAQGREQLRAAFTNSVALALASGDAAALHRLLEPLAVAGELDYLVVTDLQGREVVGLQRAIAPDGPAEYAAASGTDLGAVAPVGAALAGEVATGWMRAGDSIALVTVGPVNHRGARVGAALVGTRLETVLAALARDNVELAFLGGEGEVWGTTLTGRIPSDALALAPEAYARALRAPGPLPVREVELSGADYRLIYMPFVVEGAPLGVFAVAVPDTVPALTGLSGTLLAGTAGVLAGLVALVVLWLAGRLISRLGFIAATAEAFGAGNLHARTHMEPTDEVGALGAAFDRLAERLTRRTESLEQQLRAERREAARLTSILESIPDGLVVQDLEGRVVMMNAAARKLLGGQRSYRAARLHDLASVVTDGLGPALAPGIYALGDPAHIPLDGRMLHAQAAAILTQEQERLGTVIVVRDVTQQIVLEQARDDLLDRLEAQVPTPARPQSYESLTSLAREVADHTQSLQQVIAELRDLSTFEPRDLRAGQRALELNQLLRQIGAEWQPHAKTANLRFQVQFGPSGRHILGDERRLRWAIGNVIDNAIKYSPPGSTIALSARISDGEADHAEIVIQDTGYGISSQDLAKAFTRFYRGTPHDAAGRPVHKPGTGQGLFIARRVIEAHGGRLDLASREGTGTAAVIRLPLTADVTLPLVDERTQPVGKPVKLSSGGPYDTVPLAPGLPRRRRRE